MSRNTTTTIRAMVFISSLGLRKRPRLALSAIWHLAGALSETSMLSRSTSKTGRAAKPWSSLSRSRTTSMRWMQPMGALCGRRMSGRLSSWPAFPAATLVRSASPARRLSIYPRELCSLMP